MKKKIKALLVLMFVMLLAFTSVLAACGGDDDADPDPDVVPDPKVVASVSLDKKTLSLIIGDEETLVATVLPATAENKSVSWSSSKADVATVTDGKVKAIAVGTATITVTTADGGKKATCAVTVAAPPVVETALNIVEDTRSMLIGATRKLTTSFTPADVTDKTITWSSSSEAVATVAADGLITAVAVGTTTITAKSKNNKTDSATINVVETVTGSIGIVTPGDFTAVAGMLGGTFYLANDIDFGGETILGRGSPKDGEYTPFTGSFDGRGYALKNFNIAAEATNSWDHGIFGRVEVGAVVKNLAVKDAKITSIGRTGIIAGQVAGVVENCYIENVTVEGTNNYNDNWCCGGGIISDISGPLNATNDFGGVGSGILRNCVVKSMLCSRSGAMLTSYPIAVANRPGGLAENVFVCTDGLTEKTNYVNPNTSAAGTFTNCHLFEATNVGTIDFSALPSESWQLNAGSFPTLKKTSS